MDSKLGKQLENIRRKHQKRMDELDNGWKTINHTHVLLEEGNIVGGPDNLRKWHEGVKSGKASGGKSKAESEKKGSAKMDWDNNLYSFEQLKEFMASEHGIIVDKTCRTRINDQVFQKMCHVVSDMATKNPEYAPGKITADVSNEHVPMETFIHGNGKDITVDLRINKNMWRNTGDVEQMLIQNSVLGHWPDNSNVESLTEHECLHIAVAKNVANSSEPYPVKMGMLRNCEAEKQIVSEAVKEIKKTEYGKSKLKDELIGSISLYAKVNSSETVAEAYQDVYANGDKANPLSIKIKELADKRLGR